MQMSACATALNERCRVYLLALRVALPDPCSLSEQRKQWRRLCAAIMQLDAPGSAQRVTRRPSGAIATRQARFRPWEQQDLLLRLHTFKSRTWFGKPSQINALACAIHGWTNTGPDRLACEFCGENLDLNIRAKWSVEDIDKVAVEYSKNLTTGHAESCPWRNTVCDASLGKFPKLPPRDVYLDYSQRYACLNQLTAVPPVDSRTLTEIQLNHSKQLTTVFQKQLQGRRSLHPQPSPPSDAISTANDSLTHHIAEHGTYGFSQRACLLAVCGWQPHFITTPPSSSDSSSIPDASASNSSSTEGLGARQEGPSSLAEGTCEMQSAALACSMCGARVGLWGFDQQPGSTVSMNETSRMPVTEAEQAEAGDKGASPAKPAGRKPASRKSSVLVDLSRTIAGGALGLSTNGPQEAGQAQAAPFGTGIHAFGSSSFPPAFGSNLAPSAFTPGPQAAASHSEPATDGPSGSEPSAAAPCGSPLHTPAFGSGPLTSSVQVFGSGLQRPAFGSGSRLGAAPGPGSSQPVPESMPDAAAAARQAPEAGASQGTSPAATPGPHPGLTTSRAAFGSSTDKVGAATVPGDGPFGGGAGLPAFGMAVLRCPPASRSPSFHASSSNSPTPAAFSPPAGAHTTTSEPAGTLADAAVQPGTGTASQEEVAGGKRKRGARAEGAGPSQPAKQARTQPGPATQQPQQELTFRVLGHHKPFCPWVALDPSHPAVCGWQWCLESLAAHWGDSDSSASQAGSKQAPSERLRQALAAIGK